MEANPLTILCGDALEKLREIPDESIQLTVTSPPYDNLRTYGGHSWDFEGISQEIYRVTCKGGIVCWNVGDAVLGGSETLTSFRQAIHFKDQIGFTVHDTMIYQKHNFAHPEVNRYHQLFEYIFIFSKGRPRCFNPICDKRNSWAGTGTFGQNSVREADGTMSIRSRTLISEYGMRGNVWKGNTAGSENICNGSIHPAKMPAWLAHDLILSWSNVNDIILDPFAGSGTTGKKAIQLGRKAILIEINPDYIPIIELECNVTIGLALA